VFCPIHICRTLSWNTSDNFLYRVFQEERSIFLEVIISVTVRIKAHMNKCLILSVYSDRAV